MNTLWPLPRGVYEAHQMSRRPAGTLIEFVRLVPLARRLSGRAPLPAGAASRALFFRIARRFTPLVAVEQEDGAQFIVRTSDAVAGGQMFVYGGWEDREVLASVFAILAQAAAPAPPGGDRVLLEVGANIGTTTVAALRSGYVSRVIAVEPHPGTARLLRQNLIANDLASSVEVINAAASDRLGEVELALSDSDSGDHRVITRAAGRVADVSARTTIAVPATTIDALIEAGTVDLHSLALVWIDAQGHEAIILDGARQLLASDVPVLLEYWPHGLHATDSLAHLEEILQAHYKRFVDLRAGLTPRGIDALPELRSVYHDETFTDLLLLSD